MAMVQMEFPQEMMPHEKLDYGRQPWMIVKPSLIGATLKKHGDIFLILRLIPLDEHRRWFMESLENPNRQILIAGTLLGRSAGVLRYDINGRGFSGNLNLYCAGH